MKGSASEKVSLALLVVASVLDAGCEQEKSNFGTHMERDREREREFPFVFHCNDANRTEMTP